MEVYFVIAAGVLLILLWIAWCFQLGALRGTAAALCRLGWIIPLGLAFFPRASTRTLPRAVSLRTIHVLVDDSASMVQRYKAPLTEHHDLQQIAEACERSGCIPKVSFLSEFESSTLRNMTPLRPVVESWLYRVGSDPWVLISDGGDQRPTVSWSPSLRDLGRDVNKKARGLVVEDGSQGRERNVWVDEVDLAPFSFEGRPVAIHVNLGRSGNTDEEETVQVQVMANETTLATVNGTLAQGATTAGLLDELEDARYSGARRKCVLG